jgi:hypothetical protein
MRVFRVGCGDTKPVPVECDGLDYLMPDADGRTMYENTHFATEAEAWECLLDEVKAGESLAERDYRQAKDVLERCTRALADAAQERVATERNFERWQSENP